MAKSLLLCIPLWDNCSNLLSLKFSKLFVNVWSGVGFLERSALNLGFSAFYVQYLVLATTIHQNLFCGSRPALKDLFFPMKEMRFTVP
jgi:hypothetical protein